MKTKKNPIALNLPEVVALLIVYGRHVVQSMSQSDWFQSPAPNPPLAVVTEHLDDLEDSEATVLTRAKGAAAARDVKKAVVEDDLQALRSYVASIVLRHPGEAAAIIASAGLTPKRFTRYHKPLLLALLGPAPLEALLRAKAAARRDVAYEWAYSIDGGATWIAMPLTNKARAHLAGLTVGATYLFRFRTTIKDVTSDWSQSVSLSVH